MIDEWLSADREAPRKQRHTARRIWQRLCEEHGAGVAEVTVRKYVRRRRRELGEPVDDAFVPQVHDPGVEAEVDWGEATVLLAGERTKVYLFHLRASHSGAAFVCGFLRETQQAFLEAHVEAFRFFGGVFQNRSPSSTSCLRMLASPTSSAGSPGEPTPSARRSGARRARSPSCRSPTSTRASGRSGSPSATATV